MCNVIYTRQCGGSKPNNRYFEDAVRFAVEDWAAGRIRVEEIMPTADWYAHNLARANTA
jgi:hypothetical protein